MTGPIPRAFAIWTGIFCCTLGAPLAATAQNLKQRLPSGELERRLAHLLQTEGRPAFGDFRLTAQPGGGVFVTRVKENSLAASLGLKKGDLITHFAEYPWWATRILNRLPKEGGHTFVWVSPGGPTIKETASGDLGIDTHNFFRPENIYANERTSHSVEWNEWMAVGLGRLTIDPEFAESALAEALRLGYPPDDLIDFSEAVLAAVRGEADRLSAALDRFFNRFPAGTPVPSSYTYALDQLLAMSHGLAGLERLAGEQGPLAPLQQDQMEKFKAWSAEDGFDRHRLTPAQRAKSMKKVDLLPRWKPIVDSMISKSENEPPFLVEGKSEVLVPPGHFWFYYLGTSEDQPVKNIAVRMEFTASLSGRSDDWSNMLDIALVNRKHGLVEKPSFSARGGSPFLSQTIAILEHNQHRDGRRAFQNTSAGCVEHHIRNTVLNVPVDQSKYPPTADPVGPDGLGTIDWCLPTSVDKHPGKPTLLEMIRVDGGVQILVDGLTLLHLPVDPRIDDVTFAMRIVGVDVRFDSFRAWELKHP